MKTLAYMIFLWIQPVITSPQTPIHYPSITSPVHPPHYQVAHCILTPLSHHCTPTTAARRRTPSTETQRNIILPRPALLSRLLHIHHLRRLLSRVRSSPAATSSIVILRLLRRHLVGLLLVLAVVIGLVWWVGVIVDWGRGLWLI